MGRKEDNNLNQKRGRGRPKAKNDEKKSKSVSKSKSKSKAKELNLKESKSINKNIKDKISNKKNKSLKKKNANSKIKEKKVQKIKTDNEKLENSIKNQTKDNKGYFLMNKFTKLFDEDCNDFINGECTNNYCKYIHNYSKKYKIMNNKEFNNRFSTLFQDFQAIAPFERKFLGKTTLDLMFIIDCTGTMTPWISACRNELSKIVENILEKNPYSKIRVSFVGYRDFSEGKNRIISKDFTENIDDIKLFISKIFCYGGGDLPEDLIGGMREGLKMTWNSNAKYCIIITDAPCHGK